MLKEERQEKILDLINISKSLSTDEIASKLNISPSTARRDIKDLAEKGKVKKIFGGAKSTPSAKFLDFEEDMAAKEGKNHEEKIAIGRFAASKIADNDFIYLDAGTSVEAMLPFIKGKDLFFVTNSLGNGKLLGKLGYSVFFLPGFLKARTDSIIGNSAVSYLKNFNFSKGFFGTNGLSKEYFFTTPDINEAQVKKAGIFQCRKAFILADSSKFGQVSKVCFSRDENLEIITCKKDLKAYCTSLKEEK